MTPFTFLQFTTFSALLALLLPLRALGEILNHDGFVVVTRHGFSPEAYLIYLLVIGCAILTRTIANAIPTRGSWQHLRAIKTHVGLGLLLGLLAFAAGLIDAVPNSLSFGVAGLAGGFLCHLAAVPLGYESRWTTAEDVVMNVPLVDPRWNSNLVLAAIAGVVLITHVLVDPRATLDTLRAFFFELESFWNGLARPY